MLLIMTVLTGVIYPGLTTLLVQLLFPHQSKGSLIEKNGKVVGSELIAQKFQSDLYFWPRPSAIDYNPLPSGAGNLGPTSDTLKRLVEQRRQDFAARNGLGPTATVPTDMLFASGSGIDPHISPEAALMQIDRVALARGFDDRKKTALEKLVRRRIEGPQFGLLGEPRVNVLKLNLSLDTLQ
jgi:K+-transporting ATPase ATPase C chain